MGFEADAFISYAHLDDVELVEGRKGWVANLHRALQIRVAQLLGKSPHIWRDPKLKGNDLFSETLVDRLRRVAVLISVVSPRYLKSEWTLRELQEFWQSAEQQGALRVHGKARVFKVMKTPVPIDQLPPELQALLGYEFFKIDPDTGRPRELNEVFGPDAQRDFWIRLDDLAHDICALLTEIEAPGGEAAAAPAGAAMPDTGPDTAAGAVFLAMTTRDLREAREALQRDLQQHGYTVLPDAVIPMVADEAETALREHLKHCRLSIHLIGKTYGAVPEGGVHSFVELQHELATERAARGGFSRLIWIPREQEIEDERQRQLIERLRLDPRIERDADLLETYFEDLRTVVQDWLKRVRAPAGEAAAPAGGAGEPARLYLMADERDRDTIRPWGEGLFEQGVEVIYPVFDGDETEIREYHAENLTSCDGVLIFYGAGNELWVQRKLREVQKSAGYGRTKPRPVTGICLLNPRTPEKERLRTHEAVVVEQWDRFSPGPLQPFVAQLKAGRPG